MISPRRLLHSLAPTAALSSAVAVTVLGIFLFGAGLVLSFRVVAAPFLSQLTVNWNNMLSGLVGPESVRQANHFAGGMLLLLGLSLAIGGVQGVFRQFMLGINPEFGDKIGTLYFRRVQLARGPKIVALGGGTGLSTLLRGLKRHSSNITAVVTVTDDGGSSGRLSQELGIIPPGDLRNCLVALADSERQLTDLFQYRFTGQSGSLSGHSLGNLLIAGLVDICDGDFERALGMASEVLNIRGRVIPSTLERVRLRALQTNGSEICGETAIVAAKGKIRRLFIDPPDAHPFPEAIRAIREADILVIGPGSVYSSVIPNLLVPGIADAIRQSKARKFYVCNVMTEPGESDTFSACEHVIAIESNIEGRLFDSVLVNAQIPSHDMLEKYRTRDQFPVEADLDRIRTMGLRVVAGDFMSESDFVRHDPIKVADAILHRGRK